MSENELDITYRTFSRKNISSYLDGSTLTMDHNSQINYILKRESLEDRFPSLMKLSHAGIISYLSLCNTTLRGVDTGIAKVLDDDVALFIEQKPFSNPLIKRRITLGLTTFGRPSLPDAIKSILSQEDMHGNNINIHIVIGVPFSSNFEHINNLLCELSSENYERIKLVRMRDYGPITKLIAALDQSSNDDIILLADDDVIYPKLHFYGLISYFYWLEERFAIGASGFRWNGRLRNYPSSNMPSESYGNIEGHLECFDIIETWCGVCLKASWFNDSFKRFVGNFSFKESDMFRQDDMVYSCYLTFQGIKKININTDITNRYDSGFSDATSNISNNNYGYRSLNGNTTNQLNWVRIAEHIIPTQNFVFDFCDTTKAEKKIAVATVCIGESYIKNMWPGITSKADYCNKHGYIFILQTTSLDETKPLIWSKLILIKKLLDEGYDCVAYIDADAIITNKTIKIESIIETYAKPIIVTEDVNGVNIGNIIVRNTAESKGFIDDCLNQKGFYFKEPWYEQAAFVYVMNANDKFSHDNIGIVPKRVINSYVNDWHQNDFIVHLAGIYGERVRGLMETIYDVSTTKEISPLKYHYELQPYFQDYQKDHNANQHIIPDETNKSGGDLYLEINRTNKNGLAIILIGNNTDIIARPLENTGVVTLIKFGDYKSIRSILDGLPSNNFRNKVVDFAKINCNLNELVKLLDDYKLNVIMVVITRADDPIDLLQEYKRIILDNEYRNITKFFKHEDFYSSPNKTFYDLGKFICINNLHELVRNYYSLPQNSDGLGIKDFFGYRLCSGAWRSHGEISWHEKFGIDSLPSTEVRS